MYCMCDIYVQKFEKKQRRTLVLFHIREYQEGGFTWSRSAFDQSIALFPLVC
jgi:hypothetical protein